MSGWPEVALSEVFDIARGGSPRPIDDFVTDSPDGINWVTIGDASEGSKYITRTKRRIRREGVSWSREVKPGDFLLTNSMSFGRPYIMRTSGCIHDGWLMLSPRRSDVDADFFYHLLGSKRLYSEFERLASGATVKNLNIDIVRSVKVALPPLPEQRRIAAILDKANELRAKRRAALEHLNGLTQAMFLEMFGDPIDNPSGYPQRRLADLVDPERGISYGIVQRGDDVVDGVPVVRIGDLAHGEIATGNLKRTAAHIANKYRRTVLRGGELVISIRGTVGRCARVPAELATGNISRELALIPLRKNEDAEFVLAVLSTMPVQRRISGDVKGIAQRGVNLEDLRELPVIQPPKQSVDRFRAAFDATRSGRALQDDSAAAMDDLFASLQHQAFTGAL